MKTVSAAEANRHFSKLLREVRDGETVIVTSRGQPVARIVPLAAESAEEQRKRREAWDDLIAHLKSRPALNLGRFDRDELYDD